MANETSPVSQMEVVVVRGGEIAARSARPVLFQIWQILLVAFLGWLSYLTINHYLLSTVRIAGISMRPTLKDSDVYLLNRWLYYVRSPKPGDIVVIRDPGDEGLSIKRIIAGPGDFVCVKQGAVYVNGKQLNEPYLRPHTRTTLDYNGSAQWMVGCSRDEFLVMGDNRDNSLDSRSYGAVTRNRILGAVFPRGTP